MGNLFHEVMPQRKLSDLILPDEVQQICQSLIQEQHRTELLRSYNMVTVSAAVVTSSPSGAIVSVLQAQKLWT